jgi:hypothetical protein
LLALARDVAVAAAEDSEINNFLPDDLEPLIPILDALEINSIRRCFALLFAAAPIQSHDLQCGWLGLRRHDAPMPHGAAANESALIDPIVSAVSSAISPHVDRGLDLTFDEIPLLRVFEQMKALEYFYVSEAGPALERILKHKLRGILFPPQPQPVKAPSKRERIAADKRATAAARNRNVERTMDLGRKLAALRDTTPSNPKFGWAVRKQFGLDDSLELAEMARVARRYGERPEIFGKVGWRVLKELASSATSNKERRQFEARISAGERVNGAEIIRAR